MCDTEYCPGVSPFEHPQFECWSQISCWGLAILSIVEVFSILNGFPLQVSWCRAGDIKLGGPLFCIAFLPRQDQSYVNSVLFLPSF